MRRIMLLLFAISVLVGLGVNFLNTSSAQERAPITQEEKSKKDNDMREPAGGDVFELAVEPADTAKRAWRENKSQRYNRQDNATPLIELPPDVGGVGVHGPPAPRPIPVAESDAVIIGMVVKAQPYFSESQTSIYSEFTIYIQEVLQNDKSALFAVGDSVIADREGGALRLPNGRVVAFQVDSLGRLPHVGKRYLLFLKRVHDNQDISLVNAYELHRGRVFPLIIAGPYEGTDEYTFLNEVRATIAQSQEGGVR